MKAEKTRKYIEKIISSGITKGIQHLPEVTKELEELESIATEYESNKRYIELGKAVEKFCDAFGGTTAFHFDSVEKLLEWAEGRE